jgi:hypothetical protein
MPRVLLTFLINNSEFEGSSDQDFQIGPVATGLSLLNGPPLAYVNDASGIATLFDICGNPVPGAENISLAYEAGSGGLYVGTIVGASFNPPNIGFGYTLVVSLESPSQGNRQASFPAQVVASTQPECALAVDG